MNKRLKIYVIGPSLETQGGISSVLRLYRDNYGDRFRMRFIPSYSGFGRGRDLFYFSLAVIRVFWACMTGKDVLFHLHTASRGSFLRKSILAAICRTFGKKHMFHVHGAMFDKFIENSSQKRKNKIVNILRAADRVVVLSEKWKQYFLKYLPEEKLKVIYNPAPAVSDSYSPRSNPKPGILFMGRIGERKGAFDLIQAVKRAGSGDFLLTMYGDGEAEKAREIVAREGLEAVVAIRDWVEHSQVGAIYEASDFLVLPSYAEGLPMSVLEAIGKGLPVISTNVGGIPEAVIDGENGFIIAPGDVEALSDRIKALAGSNALREKMGKASLKIAGEKFSADSVGKRLELLYSEVGGRG